MTLSTPAIALRDHLVVCGGDRLRVLNPTARHLWEIVRDVGDPIRAVAWLVETFGLSPERAERDLDDLFASLMVEDPQPVLCSAPRSVSRAQRPRICDRYLTHYRICGRHFSFCCETQVVASALEPPFAHLQIEMADGPRFTVEADEGFIGWRDQEPLFASTTLDGAVLGVFAAIMEYAVDGRDQLVSLHAGAVSNGQACLVLPGAGGSGKSTLTAALLAHGYGYLSDDLVPIESAGGRALPVPICLSLKAGSVPVLADLYPELPKLPVWRSGERQIRFLPPPSFTEHSAGSAVPVAALVFPRYEPDAALRFEPLDPVAVLARLMATGARLDLPLDPTKVAALCEWIEATAAFALTYSRLTDAVAVLQEQLPL